MSRNSRGTRRFTTAFTKSRHRSIFWAWSIQSMPPPHPTSWRSVLILPSHPFLGRPSGFVPSGILTKTLYAPSLSTCVSRERLFITKYRVLISPYPDQGGNKRPNSGFIQHTPHEAQWTSKPFAVTFTSHSEQIQKVVHPTRSPRQHWLMAKDLSAPLYVQCVKWNFLSVSRVAGAYRIHCASVNWFISQAKNDRSWPLWLTTWQYTLLSKCQSGVFVVMLRFLR